MDRKAISFRVREIIHEVTKHYLDEDSWLDFDHHNDTMQEIQDALHYEFICMDFGAWRKWQTARDVVDYICCEYGVEQEE